VIANNLEVLEATLQYLPEYNKRSDKKSEGGKIK